MESLSQNNIDYLDLRKVLHDSRLDHYDLFYKTDHHWKTEASFWIYTEIINYLNFKYALELDINPYLNSDNYKKTVYEEWFLGSRGKRTGSKYAGADDYVLYTPKFETSLTCEIPHREIHVEGTFEEVLINYENLKKDYFGKNTFTTYIGGDYPLVKTVNNLSHNKTKIVWVKDSFTLSLQPFLALSTNQLSVVDLRYEYYKNLNLKEFIIETDPDIVIMMYNPGELQNPQAFEFNGGK